MRTLKLAEFNREIERIGKTLPAESIVAYHKKICLEFLARVIDKTPVDTGRARGNWQVTVNAKSSASLDVTDKTGDATFAHGVGNLSALPPYAIVWVANHVHYISFLEEGTSQQAPDGMVKLTLNEMKLKYK